MAAFAGHRLVVGLRGSSRRGIAVLLAGAVLLGCGASAQGAPALARGASAPKLVPNETAFSLALLRTVGGAPVSNLVVSPESLEAGLAMLELGSKDGTAEAIARALQAPGATPATLGTAVGSLRKELTAANDITLDEADALFARSGFTPNGSYVTALRRDFASSLQSVPFASAPAAAVGVINHFVARATHDLVPVLFSAPLDPTTLLVLVDAVYFNAKWATPFPHAGTAPSAFHLQSGSTVQVRFMNLASDDVETANPAGLTALELPYRGGRFAALVLEPTSTTLGTFVAELTPGRLSSILAALRPAQLGVALPTVDLSNSSSLNSPLSTLGMGVAFGNEAELSGIVNNPRLRVSTVRQVATLRIDESGTVAAAATGIGLVPTAVAAPRRVVRIDQPFVVLVRDERTGAIVFEATVVNPASS